MDILLNKGGKTTPNLARSGLKKKRRTVPRGDGLSRFRV
jgi:hypothetical protein